MRRGWLFGLVTVVGLALCVPARAVTLQYVPKVGSVVKSKMVMSSKVQTAVGGTTTTGTMNFRALSALKVVEQVPEGLKVETSVRDATMTMSMPGAGESGQAQKIPAFSSTAIYDSRGHMVKLLSSNLSQGQAPISNDFLNSMGGISMLPEGDVSLGDTWTDTVSIPASGQMPAMEITLNSRLVELLTYQGRKCAKISSTFSGPFSLDLAQATKESSTPTGGSASGTMQGHTTSYYDYEHSLWAGLDSTMAMNMSVNPEGEGASRLGPMAMKMTMHMTVTLAK